MRENKQRHYYYYFWVNKHIYIGYTKQERMTDQYSPAHLNPVWECNVKVSTDSNNTEQVIKG